MASLSGLTKLSCDKLTIRKPPPSFEKQDVFECFIRNPEGFSRYENSSWDPLDNAHCPGTQDMYDHVNASVANVYEQIAELQSSIQSTNQHLLDTIQQIGTLNNELSARITALEGRVESEEQQTSGIWAHIETLIGWVNFIGGMLSRIEEILVTLGLL
jgi:hypothetical protein